MNSEYDIENFPHDQLVLGLDIEVGPVPAWLRHEQALATVAFRIRKAENSDIADILRLMRGLAEFEGLDHFMVATEQNLRDALFGFRCNAEALVALVDDDCVAYAIFYPTLCAMLGQRGMFLENIFVDPEFRSCGIGKALFGRVAAIAFDRGCVAFQWRVLNDNTQAINFYLAQGAEMMSAWSTCRMSSEALKQLVTRGCVESSNAPQPWPTRNQNAISEEEIAGESADQVRRTA